MNDSDFDTSSSILREILLGQAMIGKGMRGGIEEDGGFAHMKIRRERESGVHLR